MRVACKKLAAILSAAISFGANATTIDFEASGTPYAYNSLDYAIDGFIFNFTMDNVDIGPGSWANQGPAHSGHFAALNNHGGPGVMSREDGAIFSLQNLWIKGWGTDGPTTIAGFLAGAQVGLATINITGNSWQQVSLNLAEVDSIQITIPGGNFLLDDITVNAVPEPQTYAMLLAGLGYMGLAANRRRNRK